MMTPKAMVVLAALLIAGRAVAPLVVATTRGTDAMGVVLEAEAVAPALPVRRMLRPLLRPLPPTMLRPPIPQRLLQLRPLRTCRSMIRIWSVTHQHALPPRVAS